MPVFRLPIGKPECWESCPLLGFAFELIAFYPGKLTGAELNTGLQELSGLEGF